MTGNYNRQSLAERIVKSRSASDDPHTFLAKVAEECVDYMKCLAERTVKPARASEINSNSLEFRYLSEKQHLQGRLYTRLRPRERLPTYMRIVGGCGYLDQPFHAMGMRSAVRGTIRVAARSLL